MRSALLEAWNHVATDSSVSTVVPDGCRDLIMVRQPHQKPFWFVTSLDHTTRYVSFGRGDPVQGYRLRAGTAVDASALDRRLTSQMFDTGEVVNLIEECCKLSPAVEESLDALSEMRSVQQAAVAQGAGLRTFQRQVLRVSGKTPSFWLQLARVRRAARAISSSYLHGNGAISLAGVALDAGYADQAHLTRALRKWFGVTPGMLATDSELQQVILLAGYD